MATRHPLALLTAGLAAVTIAGCATTVAGSPVAATTLAPASSASTAGTTPTSVPPSSAAGSADTTTSTPVPVESSGIRPMPPLGSSGAADPSGTDAPPSGTGTGAGTVGGVDLADVLAQLDATHVASVRSTADIGKITAVVDGARAKGLRLQVVSIGLKISNDDTSAISRDLFATTGGTLVVLSPTLVSARSDELTISERDAAIKAAADGTDDLTSVTKFAASALRSAGLDTTASQTATPTTVPPKTVPPKTTPTPTTKAPAMVGGVSIAGLVSLLGSDHIAIQPGVTDVTAAQVRPDVQKAWKAGLHLSVAFLAKDPPGHLYDVSSAVMDRAGGTVVVISPKRYAISSTTIADATLQKALDSAADASSYREMVSSIVATLLKR